VYAASADPASANVQIYSALEAQGVPQQFYNGQFAEYRRLMRGEGTIDITAGGTVDTVIVPTPVTLPTDTPESDLGIIPTPVPGG
jgi:hypothetical protein